MDNVKQNVNQSADNGVNVNLRDVNVTGNGTVKVNIYPNQPDNDNKQSKNTRWVESVKKWIIEWKKAVIAILFGGSLIGGGTILFQRPAESSATIPSATIERVWFAQEEVDEDGVRGMNINITSWVQNMQDREGWIRVTFYYEDGNAVINHRASHRHKMTDGQVVVWEYFTPSSKGIWDFSLFMPYSELGFLTAERTYFTVQVEIFDDNDNLMIRSSSEPFFLIKFVVINGIRWAAHNVGLPGTFSNRTQDIGGHFTWEQAHNACPAGWRLPTVAEFRSLIDAGSVWINRYGVEGRLYGTVPNQIFLPAAGWIDSDGTLEDEGWRGFYWSRYPARFLHFCSNSKDVSSDNRSFGFPVRCVAE